MPKMRRPASGNLCRHVNFSNKSSETPFALFFEPPSMDERIINQYALHSVISSPTVVFDDLLNKNSGCYKKIVIPHDLKWEIRDKLDQANVGAVRGVKSLRAI